MNGKILIEFEILANGYVKMKTTKDIPDAVQKKWGDAIYRAFKEYGWHGNA